MHLSSLAVSALPSVMVPGNNPARRRQDEADILSLLRMHLGSLDLELIRSYFRVFHMEAIWSDYSMKPVDRNRADLEFDIVGRDPIADQRTLRPQRPVNSLAEFVEFLAELEEVFGPTMRPVRPTEGTRFLL
jgi:hypothetical protein